MSNDAAVLAANDAFYRAFRERDWPAMEALWSRSEALACIHPGWRPLSGRAAVMASWRGILGNPTSPVVQCQDAHVIRVGGAAFVTCAEVIEGARMAATNVFVEEGGQWRLVHHHAGPVAQSLGPAFEAPPSHELN